MSDCCKTQKMSNKVVYTSLSAIKFVPDQYKIVLKLLIVILLYLILFLTGIWLVSKEPFMLKYFLDRYKTEEICDKATDAFLSTLKFVPVCFVINGNVWKARCCIL